MSIFALDTNVIIPRILKRRGTDKTHLIEKMLFLEQKGLLEICIPPSTQVEIYAVLRAGRYPIRVHGKKKFVKFSYHHVMKLAHHYQEIFDIDFLEGFKTTSFGDGVQYKEVLFENMKYILGMNIKQSKEFIRNKGVNVDNLKDDYDLHVMTSALKECSANYLVTQNQKDFPRLLGRCEVIEVNEISKILPLYP